MWKVSWKQAGKCTFLLFFLHIKWFHGNTLIKKITVLSTWPTFGHLPLQRKATTMAGLNNIYMYMRNVLVSDVYSGYRVISVSNWCWSNFLLLLFLLLLFFVFSDRLQGCFQFYTTHILHPKILSGCAVWSHVIETTLLLLTLTAHTIS